jgi:hypothetical protein
VFLAVALGLPLLLVGWRVADLATLTWPAIVVDSDRRPDAPVPVPDSVRFERAILPLPQTAFMTGAEPGDELAPWQPAVLPGVGLPPDFPPRFDLVGRLTQVDAGGMTIEVDGLRLGVPRLTVFTADAPPSTGVGALRAGQLVGVWLGEPGADGRPSARLLWVMPTGLNERGLRGLAAAGEGLRT